jgi:hypothetical protein
VLNEQARGFIARLLHRARNIQPSESVSLAPSFYDASCCPNCGAAVGGSTSPYCSPECREEAAFVRRVRRALTTGEAEDPTWQAMVGELLWHHLGGGYPRRQAMIPEAAKRQVLKRTQGRCEICGNPASTFDQIGSG